MRKLLGIIVVIILLGSGYWWFMADKKDSTKPVEEVVKEDKPLEEGKEETDMEPKETNEDVRIQSDDKQASLMIPAGALPTGFAVEDISMTRISETELPIINAKEGGFIAYKLEPDGLEFNEPATFSLQYPFGEKPVMPTILMFSGDKREMMSKTEIHIDLENTQFEISAPINHFSSIAVDTSYSAASYLRISAQAEDIFVGDNTNAQAPVFIQPDTVKTYTYEDGRSEYALIPNTMRVYGNLSHESTILEPTTHQVNIPSATMIEDNYILPGNVYTCVRPGSASITFSPNFDWQEQVTFFDSEGNATNTRVIFSESRLFFTSPLFECQKRPVETDMSFVHTQPGKFSTIFLDIDAEPGDRVEVTLTGPGVAGTATREATVESDGKIQIQWEINKYGVYNVTGTVGGETFRNSVTVN